MVPLRLVVIPEPEPDADQLIQAALELLADGLAEQAIALARARREAGLTVVVESANAPTLPAPEPSTGRRRRAPRTGRA